MRKSLVAACVGLTSMLFAACDSGGDGIAGNGSGGAGGGGSGGANPGPAPRMWERTLVQPYGTLASLASSSNGTIDLVYVGSVNGTQGVVWQTSKGMPELVAADSSSDIDRPHVARDANDVVHVVWASAGMVQYAVRMGATWTVETVASDRYRPDLAVASDGTPHVAFVDEQTGNASAYHAVRGPGGWQFETVNGTDWFNPSEVGIVLTKDDVPIVAAPDKVKTGVWVAEADGTGGWKIETLATDQFSSGPIDLDIGEAGLAVAFKAESHAIVGFRATGTSNWVVESAVHHDQAELPVGITVGIAGPFVASDVDVDYPNAFGVIERAAMGWSGQLIAPRDCNGQAIAHDVAGEPIVAMSCTTGLYLMRVIGRYPDDWKARCEQAAAELCKPACTCGVNGEECYWGLAGSSTCTSGFGCASNAVAAMCGDPTVTPEALQACQDELPTLACGVDGPLDLVGACGPLYQPFQ